jgi:hypothetical protein
MRITSRSIAPALALLGLWIGAGRAARAGVIYDSGPPGFTGGAAISAGDTTAGFFSLGAAATLTEVSFVSLDQPVVSPTLDWTVYEDAGGTPGAVVASGTATPTKTLLQAGFGAFDYYQNDFSVAGPTLGAGSYFLGLADSADSSLVNGQFPRNWAENTPTGPNFLAQRVGAGPWQASPDSGVSFQLLGSPAAVAVPEPATLAGASIGLALALGCTWRRRRARLTA